MNGQRLLLLCGVFLLGCRHGLRPTAADVLPSAETSTPVSDKCWVYMHLPKCGGTTIKHILKIKYSSQYALYDSHEWIKGSGLLQSFGNTLTVGDKWVVLAGGYTEALRGISAVDQTCQWFTMFRHPVARLVSAYYFCKKRPIDSFCATMIVNAAHVDLVTFAKHWGNYAMRQFVLGLVPVDDVLEHSRADAVRERLSLEIEEVEQIPGWYQLKMYLDDQVRTSECMEIPDVALYSMLQPVQDLLRDRYTVGILEEFNTTLALFDAALHMPELDWHRQFKRRGIQNVDQKYSRDIEASLAEAWTNSDIKKYMQLDLVLYEHAVDIFRQQTRAYGLK